MNVTNLMMVVRISPCDFTNGNYRHGFNNKPSNNYSNAKTMTFQEILEKEKQKQQK